MRLVLPSSSGCVRVCTLKISAGADVTEQNAFVCVFLSEESEVTGDETCINYQGN